MTTFCRRRLSQFALPCCVFCLLAALTAAFLFSPPLQAQAEPENSYVDLVMIYEQRPAGGNLDTSVAYSVRNAGTETATGVTVSFLLEDLEAPPRELAAFSRAITDMRTENGTNQRFTWEVGNIPPGGISPSILPFPTVLHSGVTLNRGEYVIGIINATASSHQPEPGELLDNNVIKIYSYATSHVVASGHMQGSSRLALLLSVDNLRPDAGDDLTYGLAAHNNDESLTGYSNFIKDINVTVKLSDGLAFKESWIPPAEFVKSGSQSATWRPAPLDTVSTTNPSWPPTREIDIETQLTSESLDDIPLEERCITARVEDSFPLPDPSYALGSLKQCLGDDPPVLFTEGSIGILTPFPCSGDVNHICRDQNNDNTSDSQVVVAAVVPQYDETVNLGVSREQIQSNLRNHGVGRTDKDFRGISNATFFLPENVVIQVKDPEARIKDTYATHSLITSGPSWQTGRKTTSTTTPVLQRHSVQGVLVTYTRKTFAGQPGWTALNQALSVTKDREDAQSKFRMRINSNGRTTSFFPFDLANPKDLTTTSTTVTPYFFQFAELGTYSVTFHVNATHSGTVYPPMEMGQHRYATGTYTFHVGPIAELEAVAAWQTARGLEITAVNNGPDHSQGTRAVLDSGQTCDFGVFSTSDGYRSATRSCFIANAQLTDEQLAGRERVGYVENHVDYTVCIDSNANDVLPKPASESACQSRGGSWHTAEVYDHIDSNNDIYLSQAPPPSALSPSPQPRTVTNLVLRWQRLDNLFGAPVSYYEVERLDDARWKLLAQVRQTASGEQPEYEDADQRRGPSPRYRVRAVNDEGKAGPWWEHSGSQPGVALKLDKDTVKEPETTADPDNPGPEATATVTATFNGPVSSQDIFIALSATPEEEEGDSFTFGNTKNLVIPAGQRESTGAVTIKAKTDGDGVGEQIKITAAAANGRCTGCTLTLNIDDKDDPGLTLKPAQLTVAEADTTGDIYTVKLDAQPDTDVVISLTGDGDVTVQPAELTFTSQDWDQPQQVTVTAGEDADAADDTAAITHRIVDGRSDNAYDPVADVKATVTVTDNDTAGVTVEPTAVMVEEGQTGEYTVSLETEPAGSVVIVVESDHDSVTVSPSRVSLGRYNYDTGRTVTVRVRNDNEAEPIAAMLTHAVDTDSTTADEYDGVAPIASVAVSVTDDEAPTDYDTDNGGAGDGLLEIRTREQLAALRWDLDGNGVVDDPANAAAYARAFPRMMAGSCGGTFDPETSVEVSPGNGPGPCDGYELMNDITLSGNWTPIGGNQGPDDYSDTPRYMGEFNGNGHTIRNLRISLRNNRHVGLFGATGNGAVIENVGLVKVDVRGHKNVGALVGQNGGAITHAWSTGHVRGNALVDGLVG